MRSSAPRAISRTGRVGPASPARAVASSRFVAGHGQVAPGRRSIVHFFSMLVRVMTAHATPKPMAVAASAPTHTASTLLAATAHTRLHQRVRVASGAGSARDLHAGRRAMRPPGACRIGRGSGSLSPSGRDQGHNGETGDPGSRGGDLSDTHAIRHRNGRAATRPRAQPQDGGGPVPLAVLGFLAIGTVLVAAVTPSKFFVDKQGCEEKERGRRLLGRVRAGAGRRRARRAPPRHRGHHHLSRATARSTSSPSANRRSRCSTGSSPASHRGADADLPEQVRRPDRGATAAERSAADDRCQGPRHVRRAEGGRLPGVAQGRRGHRRLRDLPEGQRGRTRSAIEEPPAGGRAEGRTTSSPSSTARRSTRSTTCSPSWRR